MIVNLNRYFLKIVWIFDRWIASVFPRTLFEFRSMNWTSIPTCIVWIVDSNWNFLLITELLFLLITDLNFYSYKTLFDLWWWTYFLANDWILFDRRIDSVFPRTLFWSMTWTLFIYLFYLFYLPHNDYKKYLKSLVWLSNGSVISERLNFHRWFEPLSERLNFVPIFPRNYWLERTFEFWSMNWAVIPAKLLNHYSWAIVWILIDDLNCNSRANDWILIQYSREIVDLNRYSWLIDWILIGELNQYSREIVDLTRYSWANVWILINDLNCNSRANDWILIQYSREIVDLNRYSRVG